MRLIIFKQEIKKEELANSNSHCLIPGDELAEFKTSSSSEDERDSGPDKPTKAQRKRVRKKIMKEYDERRNGLIGPLRDAPDEAEGVRKNASEKSCIENDQDGEVAPCTNQSKVKHRRRAKKLATEKPKSSIAEKSQKDCDVQEKGNLYPVFQLQAKDLGRILRIKCLFVKSYDSSNGVLFPSATKACIKQHVRVSDVEKLF